MNTLSGKFVMGGSSINLGNLPNNISLDSKRTSEHDSFYVTSVEINQQGDNMIIQLQY